MSYCLNPACPSPQNSDTQRVCQCCEAPLRLGDRFQVLRPIGQGGFGRTFLAIDAADPAKPRCVIKQFFPQQQNRETLETAAELFRQEALRLQALGQHAQIPALIAYLEQDGYPYLVQAFIDGQNLAQELAEAGPFTEAQVRQLLADLLPVVQFMHQHQVIHRDIKPANIIRRTVDQTLCLVDMGAAKYATGTALARTGTVIGSAEYIAPEQTRGKAVFASDFYSLGATCIHLLTGLSPFDLYDSSEGCWAWRTYVSSPVSDALAQILNKMLQEAINRRYASAEQILADLQERQVWTSSSEGACLFDTGFDTLLQRSTLPYGTIDQLLTPAPQEPEPATHGSRSPLQLHSTQPAKLKSRFQPYRARLNLSFLPGGAIVARSGSRSIRTQRPQYELAWQEGVWFRLTFLFVLLALPGLLLAWRSPAHPVPQDSPVPADSRPVDSRPIDSVSPEKTTP